MALERRLFVMRGFACTTDALESLRACEAVGASARLVSRPAAMGNAECGTALRSLPEEEGAVATALAGAGIVPTDRIELEDFA